MPKSGSKKSQTNASRTHDPSAHWSWRASSCIEKNIPCQGSKREDKGCNRCEYFLHMYGPYLRREPAETRLIMLSHLMSVLYTDTSIILAMPSPSSLHSENIYSNRLWSLHHINHSCPKDLLIFFNRKGLRFNYRIVFEDGRFLILGEIFGDRCCICFWWHACPRFLRCLLFSKCTIYWNCSFQGMLLS